MKKLVVFTVFLLFVSTIYAESLFKGKIEHGGFADISFKLSMLNDDSSFIGKGNGGLLFGAGGFWLLNHQYYAGVGAYTLINNIQLTNRFQRDSYYDTETTYYEEETVQSFGYAGVVLGYILFPEKVFHGYFDLLIGAGSLGFGNDYYDDDQDRDAVFVFEPKISGEVNIIDVLKVSMSISYRLIAGINENANAFYKNEKLHAVNNSDLTGFSIGFSIRTGVF